ncbi:flavodoxin family protein [Algoriphagus sp.]|uniref:flavodoxin family protein n=1 Tax=Algoriphagus sp. TaxID=1872435 RepID=UPI002629EE4A|nr:flavodoxin family protein [Algoriphagus sp.]
MKKWSTLLFLSLIPIFGFAQQHILVAYFSQSGSTQKMAEEIANGIASEDQIALLKPIDEVNSEDLLNAQAIIVGSPVYNGNPAPELLAFLNSWPFEGRLLKDKIGAAFCSGGGISLGEEAVLHSIHRAMLIHGMLILGGNEVESAFGASAITDEGPFEGVDPLFLEKAKGLGIRVAQWVKKIHSSHTGK